VLHDHTGEAIEKQLSRLAHANVTTVPFHFGSRAEAQQPVTALAVGGSASFDPYLPEPDADGEPAIPPPDVPGTTKIIDARWRQHVVVAGRVRSLRVAPQHDAPTLELILVDDTGAISVVFLGRRAIAGVDVGTKMFVEGTVGVHNARLALLNPTYRLLA
jgi:hypothetical protein